jgi:hypothetical protein
MFLVWQSDRLQQKNKWRTNEPKEGRRTQAEAPNEARHETQSRQAREEGLPPNQALTETSREYLNPFPTSDTNIFHIAVKPTAAVI